MLKLCAKTFADLSPFRTWEQHIYWSQEITALALTSQDVPGWKHERSAMRHGRPAQEVKLFYHMVELEWDSPRTRQWAVEASTPLLPHGQHQPSAIWQLGSVCIHFSTEVLQIPSHAPMIERGEVEPHLGLRGGDPPAQLEERYQASHPQD